nr:uncharacterized protein LOC115254815 [Aedes albopictus]
MTDLPKNPWDYVSMDFSTASDVCSWKALVLTDNYSRYLVALPMDKTDTDAVKKALQRVFNTYYLPKTLKADNGPPFNNSTELKTWLQSVWGVKLIHSTPLNPSENGLVERSMQGINKISAIARLGKKNWKDALAEYVAAYNSWPYHVTKIPPAELMFGRTVRSLLPDIRTDSPPTMDEELRDRDQAAKFKRNAKEDVKRIASELNIRTGDIVLVSQPKRDKTDTQYRNAFHEVIEITGAGRATIKDLTTQKVSQHTGGTANEAGSLGFPAYCLAVPAGHHTIHPPTHVHRFFCISQTLYAMPSCLAFRGKTGLPES